MGNALTQNMQYLLLQQHLQQQQVQAAVAASKMAQVGVSDSNLANAAAASLKFGSQIDARQFAMSNPLALYQQQLQQHMQLQAQQQQQHKDSETAAEKQQRLVLLQHQQFLVQQRMMHAHLMQQQRGSASAGAHMSIERGNPRTATRSHAAADVS